MSDTQAVEMVFVCSVAEEAEALLAYLRTLNGPACPIVVDNLAVDTSIGAFKNEKVISFVLSFSLNAAAGVVGNTVYNALTAAPSATCVVGGEAVDKKAASNKAEIEAKVRSAAKPSSGRAVGH